MTKRCLHSLVLLLLAISRPYLSACQHADTAQLQKVTVTSVKKNPFTTSIPSQVLNRQSLLELNAPTVGDAAKYFSGVLVKDYGGVGGLKTVSVRSLGSSETGVLYDGIPVADAQSGQVDLSRFSSTFMQSLEMHLAHPDQQLQPARAYASASVLSMNSLSYSPETARIKKFAGGLDFGSFGLWQPSAGFTLPVSKAWAVGANAEMVSSRGDYPFTVQNGNLSEESTRQNSEVFSLQGELNASASFSDSSLLQIKASGYHSKRGLPGAIIFFNDRSVQQLQNDDIFAQARYFRPLGKKTRLLLATKLYNSKTHYTDPDFLNNQGGMDNQYHQREWYSSAAADYQLAEHLSMALSSDISVSDLSANLANFVNPSRLFLWNNLLATYSRGIVKISGSLLWSHVKDKTNNGSVNPIDKFNPTIALGIKPGVESPFLFRLFYKQVFRMPTFNELYYNFIGNSNLKPEYSRQYNAGISFTKKMEGFFSAINASADLYYNSVDDKILAIPNKNLFVWTMVNLGKVSITGLDLTGELRGRFNEKTRWSGRLAYTWQHAIDITDPSASNYKNRIPYTPDHSGSALVALYVSEWSAGYSLLFSGTRYTLGENNPTNQLDGFGVHDLFLSRDLLFKTVKMNIKLEANNTTGEQYELIRYYPMPGRSFKISFIITNI